VLLFDEPTSALDPTLVGEELLVMESLAHQGSTLIVVTHEMAFAREAADRVYYIDEGQFVEVGPPEQVIDDPQDERTQKFLARLRSRQDPVAVAEVAGIPTVPVPSGGSAPA
jgi:ABC-type polar amino acid transport system ATPase subunit